MMRRRACWIDQQLTVNALPYCFDAGTPAAATLITSTGLREEEEQEQSDGDSAEETAAALSNEQAMELASKLQPEPLLGRPSSEFAVHDSVKSVAATLKQWYGTTCTLLSNCAQSVWKRLPKNSKLAEAKTAESLLIAMHAVSRWAFYKSQVSAHCTARYMSSLL